MNTDAIEQVQFCIKCTLIKDTSYCNNRLFSGRPICYCWNSDLGSFCCLMTIDRILGPVDWGDSSCRPSLRLYCWLQRVRLYYCGLRHHFKTSFARYRVYESAQITIAMQWCYIFLCGPVR